MRKVFFLLIFVALLVATAGAQEILVSDGGLLGIEGDYTVNLTEVYYGSTLFIKVNNITAQDYAILIDGKNMGYNKITYTVTKESGNITISTNPETTNLTISVIKQDGAGYWLAKYIVFVKSLPSLSGNIPADVVLYAVFIIPVITVLSLKLLIILLRAII